MRSANPRERSYDGLKVTSVKSITVSVPMGESYSLSVGKVSGTKRVMVEVETSEGHSSKRGRTIHDRQD